MKNLILSVQHLLAMYAGAILVPIIVGTSLKFTPEQIAYLVTVDIFMCGVATFLQANKVTGTGLPIVLGCTFTAVAPMILIVAIVSLIESTGVYHALSEITGKKLERKDFRKGYTAEGLAI
ncbi:hypothetical protein I6F03_15870, partial [Staphylococcus aureus]|nr:hypothetical protein [Staphylococcus aureus]